LWAAPHAGSSGILRGRLLVARDVTAERIAEEARDAEVTQWRRRHDVTDAAHAKLRALHQDLEARRQEAENLNQELRTLDGMKSDLLANVSHELQTPLVSIRGYTEMILKGRLGAINDEQRKGLSLSLKNIDRLIAMIDNLLAFARMDRESGAMKISTFSLIGVVDEALTLLSDRIEAKNLNVVRQIDDPTLAVRADRDKILQVFLNILGNAVKFNREAGAIEVVARPGKPGFVLVQVRDTGVGIAKEDLEKVFDRFYQSGGGAAQGKEGTGIGLAIVRNILRLHGCVIHATSEADEGTVLSFTLPVAGEGAETRDAGAPVEPPPGPPRDDGERPRLRIIRRG
jgi:signal transduction histidine kinase